MNEEMKRKSRNNENQQQQVLMRLKRSRIIADFGAWRFAFAFKPILFVIYA